MGPGELTEAWTLAAIIYTRIHAGSRRGGRSCSNRATAGTFSILRCWWFDRVGPCLVSCHTSAGGLATAAPQQRFHSGARTLLRAKAGQSLSHHARPSRGSSAISEAAVRIVDPNYSLRLAPQRNTARDSHSIRRRLAPSPCLALTHVSYWECSARCRSHREERNNG